MKMKKMFILLSFCSILASLYGVTLGTTAPGKLETGETRYKLTEEAERLTPEQIFELGKAKGQIEREAREAVKKTRTGQLWNSTGKTVYFKIYFKGEQLESTEMDKLDSNKLFSFPFLIDNPPYIIVSDKENPKAVDTVTVYTFTQGRDLYLKFKKQPEIVKKRPVIVPQETKWVGFKRKTELRMPAANNIKADEIGKGLHPLRTYLKEFARRAYHQ